MGNSAVITVVQPWFSALGHPAQSALNISRIIPRERVRDFLISSPGGKSTFNEIAAKIGQQVPLRTFRAPGANLRLNTLLAAVKLVRRRRGVPTSLFFVDGDLLMTCLLFLCGLFRRHDRVCVVCLAGPEAVARHAFKETIVRRALRSGRLRLFLRTPELVEAWSRAYPDIAPVLRLLPPVEGVLPAALPAQPVPLTGPLRIGVIGQVRIGKCIPALLEAGSRSSESVSVSVYGPLYDSQPDEFLRLMRTHPRVHLGFMTEETMLGVSMQQDYLACLFEENIWDIRMESATFWLAVKTGKPVLCFGSGWIAKKVRQTGCGVILENVTSDRLLFDEVPRRDTTQYQHCLSRIENLRQSLAPAMLWEQLEKSLG